MFLTLLATVLFFLLIWLNIKWRRVKNFWTERGVPHYPPHPIFGSLSFLQRQNPSVWMRQVYKDFKSPYVGMWAFWRPGLVVNSPEIARNILVKDHDVFRNRFLSSGKSDPIGSLNLFTVNDPTWSYIRRRLTVLFTASKLRRLDTLMNDKASNLVQRIREETGKNKLIDLRDLAVDYSTDVIGEATFGVKSEASKTGESAIRQITKIMMRFSFYRGVNWSSIFFFPELVDIFRFKFIPNECVDSLRSIFRYIIEQRGGFDTPVKESKDLLDALVKIKQEGQVENEEISEDLLLAQAAIFLIGGFDTSGITLTWALYELAWNRDCQEKLYREVLKSKDSIGDTEFDATTQLSYVNCVINETLRKYPTMGWLDRIASQDYKIDENLTIPAGTVIYVNAVGLQVDEKYYPHPEIFDPERFSPENERNITPYTFMPFGEGPRNCIGKRFAYQSLRSALSQIILNYELRPIPHTSEPNECSLEKYGLLLSPENKLSIDFIPRENLVQ